jgi:hypothetical protein
VLKVSFPIAVVFVYQDAAGVRITVEAAGLTHASPLPGAEPWSTVDAALAHAAGVIAEHAARKMPAGSREPLLDYSFDTGEVP